MTNGEDSMQTNNVNSHGKFGPAQSTKKEGVDFETPKTDGLEVGKATHFVRVKLLRSETDHLLRLVNSDYHACIGADELTDWQARTEHAMTRLAVMHSNNANDSDIEWQNKAIHGARERLSSAAAKIATATKTTINRL